MPGPPPSTWLAGARPWSWRSANRGMRPGSRPRERLAVEPSGEATDQRPRHRAVDADAIVDCRAPRGGHAGGRRAVRPRVTGDPANHRRVERHRRPRLAPARAHQWPPTPPGAEPGGSRPAGRSGAEGRCASPATVFATCNRHVGAAARRRRGTRLTGAADLPDEPPPGRSRLAAADRFRKPSRR